MSKASLHQERIRPASGLPASAVALLQRADDELLQACRSHHPHERYTSAHLAALRAGAALLAVYSTPSAKKGPRSVWEMLPAIAPELEEWAAFFAVTGRRRITLEASPAAVTSRDADDLVRDASSFVEAVRAMVRAPTRASYGTELAAMSWR